MDILDNVELGFADAVNRLKNSATQFMTAYNQFIAIPVEYRSPTWGETKSRADNVKAIISTFTGAIDATYKWLANAFGLSGLGALPVAPWLTVAAIGGAISAIMVAYSYMVEELNKSAYKKQLMTINAGRVEQGLEPLDLTELTRTGPTTVGDFATMAKWIVIGGAAIFIVPKLLEQLKGR